MRFGQTLRQAIYPPWRNEYIDYPKLKKLLREDSVHGQGKATDEWTDQDAEDFYAELANVQLEKVQKFHKQTYAQLKERIVACEGRLYRITGSNDTVDDKTIVKPLEGGVRPDPQSHTLPPGDVDALLRSISTELDGICKEVGELEKYCRINYTGFLKIAKKHDRKRGDRITVRTPLQLLLAKAPFYQEDYSPLLYRIATMWAFIREQLESRDRMDSNAGSMASDDSSIAYKFWVHPNNILEVKTMILRRLPVLVYAPSTTQIVEAGHKDPTITSLYFDNPSFDLYSAKVNHDVPASSLRLRWSGPLSEKPDIFFEKKTVRDDDRSEDQRFTIKEKHILPFIRGEYDMQRQIDKRRARAGSAKDLALAYETNVRTVQEMIRDHGLQPMLRANYTRTAFQIPGDERIKVTLDTNLTFSREDSLDEKSPNRPADSWHRNEIDDADTKDPYSIVDQGQLLRFPYAVLEIKVRGYRKREWIDDIASSHLVREAPRFSKYVHGVAKLFEDNVNAFPFWLSMMEEDIRKGPEDAFKEEQARLKQHHEDDAAVGSFASRLRIPSNLSGSLSSPTGSSLPAGMSFRNTPIAHSPTHDRRLSVSERRKSQAYSATIEEDDEASTQSNHEREQEALTTAARSMLGPALMHYASSFRRRDQDAQLPPGVQKPTYWIKDEGETKVEVKVWLANERTFVKWQNVSVLLASLSLGLYNAAGAGNSLASALAVVYTALALFIGAWGWWVYVWRSRLIEQRSGQDFDAPFGPVIACLGLVTALVINFALKVR